MVQDLRGQRRRPAHAAQCPAGAIYHLSVPTGHAAYQLVESIPVQVYGNRLVDAERQGPWLARPVVERELVAVKVVAPVRPARLVADADGHGQRTVRQDGR